MSKLARLEGLEVGNVTRDLRILFIGDSIDVMMTYDAYHLDNEYITLEKGQTNTSHCWDHLHLRVRHIPGSHAQGPYHFKKSGTWESPYVYINQVIFHFHLLNILPASCCATAYQCDHSNLYRIYCHPLFRSRSICKEGGSKHTLLVISLTFLPPLEFSSSSLPFTNAQECSRTATPDPRLLVLLAYCLMI